MSQNVGQIDLDLVLNGGNLRNQVTNLAGFAAKTFASVFAAKQVVGFTKKCLELGSNLTEVQNVVDVTFKTMSQQVNDFASTSITQLGMSETACKQFMGTYGAMSKAMGFSEQSAYNMSKSITQLTGDVASFFNISSKEAAIKLKSIWTGETETLKDLGVVMTQTNLDNYAMANGFGKTTKKMSEAEKVVLRYNYVMNSLKDAQGDFVRTQDSFANQTRILKEQFNALCATIGQALIPVITPVIKWLNTLILKLQQAAKAFKLFVETIFGKQSESSGLGSVAGDLGSITDGATSASDAVGGIGDSAASAAKELEGLMGFDEINKLSKSDSSDSGVTPEIGGVTDDVLGAMDDLNDKTNKWFDDFMKRMEELKDLFVEGFKIGFGDTNFAGIKESITNIKESLKDIFTDPKVQDAVNEYVNAVTLNLGKICGAVTSMGVTIAENLVGGIAKYLEQSKDYIKERLIGILNVKTEIANIIGDFAVALADIFSVFRTEEAKQLTADIIGIFADGFLGVTELALKFGRDIIGLIINPIIENKDKIKEALLNIIKIFEPLFGSLKTMIDNLFEDMNNIYNEYFKPAFDKIEQGISSLMGSILGAFNSYIAPALRNVAEMLGGTFINKVEPFLTSVWELIGKIFKLVSTLWKDVVEPLLEEIVNDLGPAVGVLLGAIGESLDWLIDLVLDVFTAAIDITGNLVSALTGLTEFIGGAMAHDWSAAWQGIKDFAVGIFDALNNLIAGLITFIADFFCPELNTNINDIKKSINDSVAWLGRLLYELLNTITQIWESIKTVCSETWSSIKKTLEEAWQSIKDTTTKVWDGIKDFLSKLWGGIKETCSTVWSGIKIFFDTVLNGIKTVFETIWDGIKGTLTTIWGALSGLASTTWAGIKTVCESVFNGLKTSISTIWGGIKAIFMGLIDFVKNVFAGNWKSAWDGVVNTFKSTFEKIKDFAKAPLNAVIKMINTVIKGMNKLSFDIPDWVPGVGGKSFGVDIPSIPALAKGGIIDTPTLAMVGEAGKEAVMPLENNTGWINQLAGQIAGQLGGLGNNNNSDGDLNIELKVGEDKLGEIVIRQFRKLERKTGKAILNI